MARWICLAVQPPMMRAALQENLEQAAHAHVMDFGSLISDRADGDGEGNAL